MISTCEIVTKSGLFKLIQSRIESFVHITRRSSFAELSTSTYLQVTFEAEYL